MVFVPSVKKTIKQAGSAICPLEANKTWCVLWSSISVTYLEYADTPTWAVCLPFLFVDIRSKAARGHWDRTLFCTETWVFKSTLGYSNSQDRDGATTLWIKFQKKSTLKNFERSVSHYTQTFLHFTGLEFCWFVSYIFHLHSWETEWKSVSDLQLERSPFNLYKIVTKRWYNQSL